MLPLSIRARRTARAGAAALGVALASLLPVNTVPGLSTQAEAPAPLVGFSFVNESAYFEGMDPGTALGQLLRDLHPDLVRLPVYWSDIEAQKGTYDYDALDSLLDVVTTYNATASRPARVILAVGARNLSYPEVYLPSWVLEDDLSVANAEKLPDYRAYFEGTIKRYARNPLIYYWQVENEGLDNVSTESDQPVALSLTTVAAEVRRVHQLDGTHPAIVTTFNSSSLDLDRRNQGPLGWLFQVLPGPHASGHPAEALKAGDIMGLDVYVATPFTPLGEVSAAQRIQWKGQSLSYWADAAGASGKQLWITEMQAYPWIDSGGFTASDLRFSALQYRDKGVNAVLLWGVENWLGDPTWMRVGKDAIALLRQEP